MEIKIVIDTIKEMIQDNESELYMRIYLNDLTRSNDITNEQNLYIYNKYIIPYLMQTKKGILC